ncbi:UNVERIFIED_CONTAM: hypothetical protein RMT77_009722 [Armadillidium vulgare]
MEAYAAKINQLAERKQIIERNLTKLCEDKQKALEALKNALSSKMMDFCKDLVTQVEQLVEFKNSKMENFMTKIDQNLTQSSAVFEELTSYRSKFIDLYNSISIPKISIDSTMVTQVKTGRTMEDLERIPTKARDVISNMNEIRSEHEPLLTALEENLFKMIEKIYDQMRQDLSNQIERTSERGKKYSVEIEHNIESSQKDVERISQIRDKIQYLVTNNDH